MQVSSKLNWIDKSFRYLLLILYLGYYSSITLFPHAHIINGVTIVHSHPFNSDNGRSASNSPHNGKELQLINLLSEFFTTALSISIAALILRALLYEIPVNFTEDWYAGSVDYCTCSLRAPPIEMPHPVLK
jgi:hypothetical protein